MFWAFMDMEKAYDTIDRHGMWQMLRVDVFGGKLLKEVQIFMYRVGCVFGFAIFAWPCVLSERAPELRWLSPGERWDAVT